MSHSAPAIVSIQRARRTAHRVIQVTRGVIRYRVRAYPERVSSLLIRPVWTVGIDAQQYSRSPDLPALAQLFETNRFSPSHSSLA